MLVSSAPKSPHAEDTLVGFVPQWHPLVSRGHHVHLAEPLARLDEHYDSDRKVPMVADAFHSTDADIPPVQSYVALGKVRLPR